MLLDVNVLQAVGVPVQVPPAEDQVQLAESLHVVLSVNVVHAVGVPVHSEAVASQTHPTNRAQVLSPELPSEQAKDSDCRQLPAEAENLQPGSKLHDDCVPSLNVAHEKLDAVEQVPELPPL